MLLELKRGFIFALLLILSLVALSFIFVLDYEHGWLKDIDEPTTLAEKVVGTWKRARPESEREILNATKTASDHGMPALFFDLAQHTNVGTEPNLQHTVPLISSEMAAISTRTSAAEIIDDHPVSQSNFSERVPNGKQTSFLRIYSEYPPHDQTSREKADTIHADCKASLFKNRNWSSFIDLITWDEYEIQVRGCESTLRNITVDWARDVLKSKFPNGVVIMGDSISSCLYLNLVYFLHTGNWNSPHPQNEVHYQHGSWPNFFNTTNSRFQGHEVCDCYRKGARTENRFYSRHGVRLTFIQVANRDLQFHPPAAAAQCSPCCPPSFFANMTNATKVSSMSDPVEALRAIVRELGPTDLVLFSAGHGWKGPPFFQGRPAGFAARLADCGARRFVWRSTTAPGGGGGDGPVDADRERRGAAGLPVFDAYSLTRAAQRAHGPLLCMWDVHHFYQWVYVGLNKVLLAYLAGLDD